MRRVLIILAILGGSYFYIWQRFVHAPDLPEPWFALATAFIVIGAPSLPFATFRTRHMPRARRRVWLFVIYTWFGLATYLLLFAAITHLVCAIAGVSPRAAALAGVTAALATVIAGMIHVKLGPSVRRVRIALPGLPAAVDGYTIVQLTDVHIGVMLGRDFAAKVVERVNALAPDLIVITGDFVDGRLSELAPHVEPFRGLAARDGVYAVTGNHEYYWDADAWLAHLGSLGLRILRNQHVTIRGGFELAGVDDSTSERLAHGHGEDVATALAGRDPALPVVLLAHHPSTLPRARAAGVDLQLSGHTHGGQLLPFGYLSRLFEPHVSGLARFGATQLYVSEGTGFWGPPLRVGTSCEIAHITLTPA